MTNKATKPEKGEQCRSLLKGLFKKAEEADGLEYIYCLVRVEGITTAQPDALVSLRAVLQSSASRWQSKDPLTCYREISSTEEPLALLANLAKCASGKNYEMRPFRHLWKGTFPNYTMPSISEAARATSASASEAGMASIAALIDAAYPDEVLPECESRTGVVDEHRLGTALKECVLLLTSLLDIYFEERQRYSKLSRFHKLPRFEVLEILVSEDSGLNGFRMHFSNGSSAYFLRTSDATECCNMRPGPPVDYMVGDLDALRQEWRVGEKRLFEIGLPGRHNAVGQWKPIVYPGNSDALVKESQSASGDADIQGVLFYIMCTAHRGIEFVAKTTLNLPMEEISFYSDNLHLWKCPPSDPTLPYGTGCVIYDGWFELDAIDAHSIRVAINTIGAALNLLAFTYNAAISWRLKYTNEVSSEACANPSAGDLRLLDKILLDPPQTPDTMLVYTAIDWYNRGRMARNPFMAFFSYYVAIESVAVAVVEGDADFGLAYHAPDKLEAKRTKIECIRAKHTELFEDDPIHFVNTAYFDCVKGLRKRVRIVAELVFGVGHEYVASLVDAKDRPSLYAVRSKIAHGDITLFSPDDEKLVRDRLPDLAAIAKEFLMRLILRLKPEDPLPTWSREHTVCIAVDDPRTTFVVSGEKMLPKKDWRIQPEWCEE